MKFLTQRPLYLCLVVAMAFVPAAHAVTIANGGFETGDFTGWTLFGNTAFVGVDSGAPQAGSYGAYFGSNGAVGGISQLISTTAGAAYDVGFWLKSETDPNGVAVPNSFSLSWGATQVLSLTNLAAGNYTYYTSHVLATSSSTALTFSFRNDPAFFDLDSVSIAASVPEPSAFALLGVGGLALVGYRRRQQKQQSARLAQA